MARPIRIQYPDAVYHVLARGNQGRAVFRDPADRKRFLETLSEASAKPGWQVHACVLKRPSQAPTRFGCGRARLGPWD